MGGMFLLRDDNEPVELKEQPYEAEVLLQNLLANHPNILAGDQIDSVVPRRWLLISRETPVPSEEGGTGRWALDHLFLDQDAIPTLVEVKRSTDTRIRREVVGQMLDYAANAVTYWPAETMRAQFEYRCDANGIDPADELSSFLDPDTDPETFWQMARQNLQAERIRLVFVADIIPQELRRIIEFLNKQMTPAEVIAVEMRQFVGQGVRALVPRVVSQSAAAQQAKVAVRSAAKRKWDEESFFQELSARKGPQDVAIAREILAWAIQRNLSVWWGKGIQDGSFVPMVYHEGLVGWTISVWTYGRLEVQFQHLAREQGEVNRNPFAQEDMRLELLRRFNEVRGVELDRQAITKRPAISLAVLAEPEVRGQFLAVLDWLVAELRGS